jgi:hypothetical protein
MSLTSYTTYDDIRAVLGVSDDDLDDATLALEVYESFLVMDLEDIRVDLPELYTTTTEIASPSAGQIRFIQSTRLFATYSVAKQLASSLPLFAAKEVTDSKAGVTRFDSPYKDVILALARDYERLRTRLIQALNVLGSETQSRQRRSLMSVVSPVTDPITGAN